MLHGRFYEVEQSREWTFSTFSYVPEFVAKTCVPSVPDLCFVEVIVLPLRDLDDDDDDREEFFISLLCSVTPWVPVILWVN